MIQTLLISSGILSIFIGFHLQQQSKKFIDDFETNAFSKMQLLSIIAITPGGILLMFGLFERLSAAMLAFTLYLICSNMHRKIMNGHDKKREAAKEQHEKEKIIESQKPKEESQDTP